MYKYADEATAVLRLLKALCHDIRLNCVLMSSLFQKSNQSGYRKYWHAQYYGIVYGSLRRSSTCSMKILLKSSGEPRNLQRYGRPKVRILISKGSRADMLLEMSSA